MARIRISTTVDEDLLTAARQLRVGVKDAALIDEALEALSERHRKVEIDESYAIYDPRPMDEEDEWGSLAAFREAAGSS